MEVTNCEHPAPSHCDEYDSDDSGYSDCFVPTEYLSGSDLGMREWNQLCSSCSNIDFRSTFALSSEKIGREGRALFEMRTDTQPGCDLCSLVASMASLKVIKTSSSFEIPETGYHLRALDSLWPLGLPRTVYSFTEYDNPSIVVAVVEGRASTISKGNRLHEATRRGFIVPVAQDSPRRLLYPICPFLYRARAVSSTKINYARIGFWLRECQKSKHSYYVGISQPRWTAFCTRVIDCETREILPLTPNYEYLALSYVWGKTANDAEVDQTDQSNHCLPDPAPQTIEDAMTVVRGLRKRYLWVDRYCIWQSEDKHLQIQNMDQIYQNALTTIVAADGDNAESGLSGVSCPRHHQSSFQTNAGVLAYTFPHVSCHLSTSTWVSRGWTYQEAILSRSCLFFTKDQVYFACKGHLGSESEAVGGSWRTRHSGSTESLTPRLMRISEQADTSDSQKGPPCFYDHIKEYTSRSLSWDSDALNAFKGILASLDEYTYWGIPFSDTFSLKHYVPIDRSEAAFAHNLAWTGKRLPPGGGAIRRRKGIPTWSWTSLVDQIVTKNKSYTMYTDLVKCSAFYVEDDTPNRLSITDVFQSGRKRGTRIIPEHGRVLLVEALVTEVCLRSTRTEGVYSIHLPEHHTLDLISPYSRSTIIGAEALIDCTDADLLSRIESQPWSAIKLFWDDNSQLEDLPHEEIRRKRDGSSYWMLVDQYGLVARRIGLIRPRYDLEWNLFMSDLKAERRLTRIE